MGEAPSSYAQCYPEQTQPEPIGQAMAQRARAKAEGHIAPRPSNLETAEARKERWASESNTSTPFEAWAPGVPI
jgi:hypothetical protein